MLLSASSKIPLSMEHFPSAYRALDYIEEQIKQADIFFSLSAPPWAVLLEILHLLRKNTNWR